MKKHIISIVSLGLIAGPLWAGPVDKKHIETADAALAKGTAWLAKQQQETGHWSNKMFPALTALPLWALTKAGWEDKEASDRAVKFILSCVNENGAIFREPKDTSRGGGMANYNTALCMVALHEVGDAELVPVIQRARTFLSKTQLLTGDSVFRGGMGYDPKNDRNYTDLSNSYIAYEAMRMTENVEDLRKKGDPRADLDWKEAIAFIERVHNHPDFNEASWVDDSPENKGGFAYHPYTSMAGAKKDDKGVVKLNSFGSMTYAGMLSYIYAKVDKDDPRVTSTFEWAARHWTLQENPGTGQEGLFYYFNVLSKGLDAFGKDTFKKPDGKQVNWRQELIDRLASAQTPEGLWKNDVGRYWESDPVLVTSYSMLALAYALGR